ncbi:hypothetical protein HHUSO_G36546 [Huso huso]|uniref:Uncharacterized protein n=1 Tax=Huso huso TaxID=61971 RepID=A0ABR0Y109_HUSHU
MRYENKKAQTAKPGQKRKTYVEHSSTKKTQHTLHEDVSVKIQPQSTEENDGDYVTQTTAAQLQKKLKDELLRKSPRYEVVKQLLDLDFPERKHFIKTVKGDVRLILEKYSCFHQPNHLQDEMSRHLQKSLEGLKAKWSNRQMVHGTSPANAQGPATKCRVPAARKWSLAHLKSGNGRQQLCKGSQRLAKWYLAPPLRTYGDQRPRTGSQQLAKLSLVPAQRTHPAQRPRAEAQRLAKWSLAPYQHTHVPAACKWSLAPPAHAWGPATPRGDPAVRQMVPGSYSVHAQGPATTRGVPAARKWSLAHPQHGHGIQQPHAWSQRLAKWSLAHPQSAHEAH